MQINTPHIHEKLINENEVKRRQLEKRKIGLIYTKNTLIENFKSHKLIFDKISNKSFDYIIESTTLLDSYNLKLDISKINVAQTNFNPSNITTLVNLIIRTNKELKAIKTELEFINNTSVHYIVHKHIIDLFNVELIDRILQGYTFKPGFGLNEIRIRAKKRVRPTIDWESSNQYKQRLIDEGKTPYNKETAPDGVKWLIEFNNEIEHWWYWEKPKKSHIPNFHLYSFVPSSGKNGAIAKLRKVLKSNEYAHLNFNE